MVSCAPVGNRRLWLAYMVSPRVTNPPQVANLPHNFRRILSFGKTKWHWAQVPAAAFQATRRLKAVPRGDPSQNWLPH